ncbi:dicarboxylate/amino acid:cation symporter [Gimesia aquarii]|uniref:Proton/sodium-glutamate symport protein n=1 Tax=Gimesia aquarii TaxID=2527964 RepID=A0A517WWE5_9PLAN|nr:dicarboxylate/amino acid:cation symporter [Gimesia aquarii]QDU09593.1 Proton/sodium-glutamate symport protein [Gimesia aquarii]
MKKIPLHYQILIALIVGTFLGFLFNPGEITLADLSLTASRSETGYQVIEKYAGDQQKEYEFKDRNELVANYPELAKLFAMGELEKPVTVEVNQRSIHIVDSVKKVTLTYTRSIDQKMVVTSYSASSGEELVKKYPQWETDYFLFGTGLSQKVMVISKWLGDLFLRLLKMVTIPLIVTSLITGIASLGNATRFGAMFSKTLLYYLFTSLLAISTGILVVNLIRPGIGAELPGGSGVLSSGRESVGSIFLDMIDRLIPTNIIHSLGAGEFLSIISFSMLAGIFIILVGGKHAKVLTDFFQAGFEVMMRMTMFVISLAPIGVTAFMIYAVSSQGIEIFKTLGWYMITVSLALLIHAVVILPCLLKFVAGRSPLQFAHAMSPALMTAFSTASSNGTLPLTMTCVEENAKVSNEVSSFVLPLGATINMDGTALYEAVAVLFIAQAYTGVVMPLPDQILVAVTALLASIGAAGIPHAGLVMMAIVLQAVGLPLEAQGVIIAVDRVLDMCRTSVNVWSDSCGCAIIERYRGPAASSNST